MTKKVPFIPVILSGGSGTRLWPLSRVSLPKQLLALGGERTMIQDTALRVAAATSERPIVICSEAHRFLVAQQMQECGVSPRAIVLEPEGRNTAPAAAIAALLASEADPKAIVALLPSDHRVSKAASFEAALGQALEAAREGWVVTFGISPSGPETGYGYIEQGDALSAGSSLHKVMRFVEKPDLKTAQDYLSSGRYTWNSGMFVFRADVLIAEFQKYCPDILDAARATLAQSLREQEFIRLDGVQFKTARNTSIDYALMEKTSNGVVIPCEIGWSDVGSFSALWAIETKNADQNVFHGDVHARATTGSYVHSKNVLTTLVGVKDLVVVATDDAVLVASKDHAQDVKDLVDALKAVKRSEPFDHAVVQRPWGTYQTIDMGEGYQVKRIVVNPGGKLSLQMHHKRAEHWTVAQGTARVTCDDKVFELSANQSTFIPLGAKHRLENIGTVPLFLIEVQCGSYLGEDDIVRFDDIYGRAPAK
jgi:mannose-1-phosphate guanylyltransferase/mannose-6-phosphate isomerase